MRTDIAHKQAGHPPQEPLLLIENKKAMAAIIAATATVSGALAAIITLLATRGHL